MTKNIILFLEKTKENQNQLSEITLVCIWLYDGSHTISPLGLTMFIYLVFIYDTQMCKKSNLYRPTINKGFNIYFPTFKGKEKKTVCWGQGFAGYTFMSQKIIYTYNDQYISVYQSLFSLSRNLNRSLPQKQLFK